MNKQMSENMASFIAELRENKVELERNGNTMKYQAPQGVVTDEILNTMRENKDAILEILELEKLTGNLCVGHREEKFGLTDVQSAYLLGRKGIFKYGNTACHIYMEIEYPYLDIDKTEEIWNQLIERHSMLRVVFEEAGYQRILKDVPHYTLYTSRPENHLKTHKEIERELGHKIYDINVWPLFDIGCIAKNEKSFLVVSIDFMIADWASIWILISEFEKLYKDTKTKLPALHFEFSDYIEAENRQKLLPQFYRDKKYWTDRIPGLPCKPELPLVHNTAENRKVEFKRYKYILDQSKWSSVAEIGKSIGVTPSAVVMAAYAMSVARWSENKHFLLNLTMLNRKKYGNETENIVGDFTSVTLLEVDFSESTSFAEKVKALQHQLFCDLDHHLFSGIDVLREIGKSRGNDAALMPVVFTSGIGVIHRHLDSEFSGSYNQNGISQTPQVFIDCQVLDQNGELLANWDVREGILLPGVPEQMFNYFIEILNILSDGKDEWENKEIHKLPAETGAIAKINTGELPEKLLHADVWKMSKTFPDKTAVISREGTLTYQSMMEKSWAVQNRLQLGGCKPDSFVGIAMPKSYYQVVGVLGILLNGSAYVPIDISQPKDRIIRIIKKAEIKYILSIGRAGLDCPKETEIIEVDKLGAGIPGNAEFTGGKQETKPAYAIFTSGSTGNPKGVVISHASAVNTIVHVNQLLGTDHNDSVLGVSRLSFDLSVFDIFGLLSAGGTLVYPDEDKITDPSHLYRLMMDHQITLWNSVPAISEMLIEYKENEGFKEKLNVRKTLLSGDWIPLDLPDRIKRNCVDETEVISLGGATEAAIWSIYFPYKHRKSEWNSIPYGKALPNQFICILNDAREICPMGVKGDIYIAGAGLALEYLNEPELTSKYFIFKDGIRLYYTGDKGRYMQDGNIEFLGREDTQIKVNGYRIELGEVETNLEKAGGIKRACAIVKKVGKENKIVAFLQKNKDCMIDNEEIILNTKNKIRNFLPAYMLPHYYRIIEQIPLTANGKIDRKELSNTTIDLNQGYESTEEIQQNFSLVYKFVKEIWCDLLHQNDITGNIDLHSLGADSLLMAQAVGKIRKKLNSDEFKIDIPFDVLLKQTLNTPALNEIAAFIERELDKSAGKYESEILSVHKEQDHMDKKTGSIKFHKKGTDGEVIVVFHSGLGTIDQFGDFVQALCRKTSSAVISITINDIEFYCSLRPEHLYEEIACEYSKQICQLHFKKVSLVGHCIGGMIAFETAKNLLREGLEVTDVALIDSIPAMYKIEDEIMIELMFLSILNISYEEVPGLELKAVDLLEYLSGVSEYFGGTVRRVGDKELCSDDLNRIAGFINGFRGIELDKRISLYLSTAKGKMNSDLFKSLYKIFRQNTLAASYEPIPYLGDLRLFKAQNMNEIIPEKSENTIEFWSNNCFGEMKVIMIPGNHFTCIEDRSNAECLAEKIVLA